MTYTGSTNSEALQLGTRKVTVMNFSRFVTLPLDFVKNLDENMLVNVAMTPDARKVILTPAQSEKKRDQK